MAFPVKAFERRLGKRVAFPRSQIPAVDEKNETHIPFTASKSVSQMD